METAERQMKHLWTWAVWVAALCVEKLAGSRPWHRVEESWRMSFRSPWNQRRRGPRGWRWRAVNISAHPWGAKGVTDSIQSIVRRSEKELS